jgi:hypothetical protein
VTNFLIFLKSHFASHIRGICDRLSSVSIEWYRCTMLPHAAACCNCQLSSNHDFLSRRLPPQLWAHHIEDVCTWQVATMPAEAEMAEKSRPPRLFYRNIRSLRHFFLAGKDKKFMRRLIRKNAFFLIWTYSNCIFLCLN